MSRAVIYVVACGARTRLLQKWQRYITAAAAYVYTVNIRSDTTTRECYIQALQHDGMRVCKESTGKKRRSIYARRHCSVLPVQFFCRSSLKNKKKMEKSRRGKGGGKKMHPATVQVAKAGMVRKRGGGRE